METALKLYSLEYNQAKTYVVAILFILGNIAFPQVAIQFILGGRLGCPFIYLP